MTVKYAATRHHYRIAREAEVQKAAKSEFWQGSSRLYPDGALTS